MLKAQGKSYPEMDALSKGEVDPDYLTKQEFQEEVKARAQVEFDQCADDHSLGAKVDCQYDVVDKYGGELYKERDKAESQRKLREYDAVGERIEAVKNSGPVGLAGRAAGRGVGNIVCDDDDDACVDKYEEAGATLGAAGDVAAAVKVDQANTARTGRYEDSGHVVRGDVPLEQSANRLHLVNVETARGAKEMPEQDALEQQRQAELWVQQTGSAKGNTLNYSQLNEQAREKFDVAKDWRYPISRSDMRSITVQTTKGPKQVDVGAYRDLVQKADAWVQKARVANPNLSETQLNHMAAEDLGLDEDWHSIKNPNYHSPANY
jgi:hypothetical protein